MIKFKKLNEIDYTYFKTQTEFCSYLVNKTVVYEDIVIKKIRI